MSIDHIVGSVKDFLAKVVNAASLDEAKGYANQGLQEVQSFLNKGEQAIDPWLVKWARSGWSLPLAVAFGLALMTIGDVIHFAGLVFGLLKLVF